MIKEIGGYFELENFTNNEYYKDLLPLNSGRNALLYLMKAKYIKKIYIPYYLCDSISSMLKMYGYDYDFYKIDSDFLPIFNEKLKTDEYLYIVNYYAQISNERIIQLKRKYKNIILDNTHAFFQEPINGVDTVYNCRKFFGVPDGAYLSTNVKINNKLEVDVSKERMTHLLGRYEGLASEYYTVFQNNEKLFETLPLKLMSKLTHNILGAIDYEKVREIRNGNYYYLDNELWKYNKIRLYTPNGAFAYPFYIENGTEIRKKLVNSKIYVPTLWPNVLNNTLKDSIEYKYAANILPLPCDQRYNLNDMEYIVEEIKKIATMQD